MIMRISTVVWFSCAFLLAQGDIAFSQETGDGRCTREILEVGDDPVAISLCVSNARPGLGTPDVTVDVDETFAGRGSSFARSTSLDFLRDQEAAKAIDDVSLDRLGLARSLHLSLQYRGGLVSIAHALLLPGAIPLK